VSTSTAAALPPPLTHRLLGTLLDPRRRLIALVALLAVAGALVLSLGVPEPGNVRQLLSSEAAWLPLAVVLTAATLAMLLFPRTGIAILAGVLFPPGVALLYALAGTVLGAAAAFGIGRTLGRPYLTQRTAALLPGNRLVRFQEWLDRRGTLAVLAIRLVPVIPFGLVNYAFGATRVRFRAFVVGTTLGVLPTTILHVLVGANATNPRSPAFLLPACASVLIATTGAVVVRYRRRRACVRAHLNS